MKKLLTVFIVLVMLFPISVMAMAWGTNGYIEGSCFPVNDEHATPATVEAYVQAYPYGDFFVFANPTLSITNDVPDSTRHDNTYITGVDLGVGYLSDLNVGVGYRLTRKFDVRLLYSVQKEYTGYEGDWTGIQVRYSFGERR